MLLLIFFFLKDGFSLSQKEMDSLMVVFCIIDIPSLKNRVNFWNFDCAVFSICAVISLSVEPSEYGYLKKTLSCWGPILIKIVGISDIVLSNDYFLLL